MTNKFVKAVFHFCSCCWYTVVLWGCLLFGQNCLLPGDCTLLPLLLDWCGEPTLWKGGVVLGKWVQQGICDGFQIFERGSLRVVWRFSEVWVFFVLALAGGFERWFFSLVVRV